MTITLAEVKNYLRVSTNDDDTFIQNLINDSLKRCLDVMRVDDIDDVEDEEKLRIGVYYCVAYFYEHREDTDHNKLNLTLRALFFADREVAF